MKRSWLLFYTLVLAGLSLLLSIFYQATERNVRLALPYYPNLPPGYVTLFRTGCMLYFVTAALLIHLGLFFRRRASPTSLQHTLHISSIITILFGIMGFFAMAYVSVYLSGNTPFMPR